MSHNAEPPAWRAGGTADERSTDPDPVTPQPGRVTAAPPRIRFGFDVLDALEWGWWPPFGYDVIDVLESREHDIPTRCTQCNDAWLTGPQALAAGKCWRCRTSGDAA